jgi:hypothetical protein
MTSFRLFCALVIVSSLGCSSAGDEEGVETGDDALLKKTGPTSSWSYRGLMPKLDEARITVSLKGHTAHVEGLLPRDFTGKVPFYVREADGPEGRRKVHVVYPLATVNPNGKLEDGTRTRNPEPFEYDVCDGANFAPTNDHGAFGGFPFIEYVCDHVDKDGRRRS